MPTSARWVAERVARHRDLAHEAYEVTTSTTASCGSSNGTSTGCIVGLWSDVTALRQAEKRLNDAVNSINEGFILLDAEMRYVVFNDEFLRLYPRWRRM